MKISSNNIGMNIGSSITVTTVEDIDAAIPIVRKMP